MRKAYGIASLIAAAGIAWTAVAAAEALSEDDCRAVWNTAAGRSDLSAQGAKPYIDDFAKVDTNGDGKITNAEFKAGCKAGLVHKFRGAP
ncbi:EF-hand domain-containing protein [Hyphomicrobium sp.]|uniref:EF-hand domain-containing protein n=1 Tax=Hyphomicrobium sp. TaxID=82 RepID=UPI003F72E2FA